MREIIPDINKWFTDGQQVALATVVRTWGSSPRTVGSKMAVNQSGEMVGSVSGGCVEGAVAEVCQGVIAENKPQLLHFGVADETAWEVGLACGGMIDVYVQPLSEYLFSTLKQMLAQETAFALAMVIAGPDDLLGKTMILSESGEASGSIAFSQYDEIKTLALGSIKGGTGEIQSLTDDIELFIDVNLPPPRLIVVGGVHIAVSLVKMAKAAGFQTIVIDPRRQFASQERFPDVDSLIQDWPDKAIQEVGITSNTAITMLTHDPKIDDPGLIVVLPSLAFYIGALGSQKTQAGRRERLLAAGVNPAHLARLRGPIGLDLGGRSPQEIAVAILAEIVQARYK
jgi:xanthine dehydrogenase accessory factor